MTLEALGVPGTQQESPSPAAEAQILPELREILADMDPDEQAVVTELLRRSRTQMPEGATEITVIHGAMKSEGLAIDYDELSTARAKPPVRHYPGRATTILPEDHLPLGHPLERVLAARASRRDYTANPLSLRQLGTLLHYSWGVRKRQQAYNTRDFPVRFAPSSGGLQSVELYVVANDVEGLPQGAFHYDPGAHAVELLNQGNMRRKLVQYASYQEWLHYASAVVILACRPERIEWKYGTRGYRFMHMDAGFVGQNLYLVATSLSLRGTAISGFSEDAVNDLLGLDGRSELALLLFAVGTRDLGADGGGATGDGSLRLTYKE